MAEPAEPDGRLEPEEIVGWVRSPSDVLRLVSYAVASLCLLGLARWAEDAVVGFERDLIELAAFLPPSAERLLAGVGTVVVAVIGLAVFVPPIVLKRYRLLWYQLVANVLSAGLVGTTVWWLDRAQLPQVSNEVAERAGADLTEVLSPRTLAQVASSFVILAPFVSSRWRRAGATIIVLLAVLKLLVTAHLPAEVLLSLTLGALAGTAVLATFGRPDQRPTPVAVRRALVRSGLDVVAIRPASVEAQGSLPFVVDTAGGGDVFAKVLSPADRAADLLFRTYRFLRLKNVGDERPFSSLRRTVEHEALVSLQARDVGVRTPRMRAIADVGDDSMLLAYDLVEGSSLDRVDRDAVSDDLLRELCAQVALLHRHRIAHRDLRRANVLVDVEGRPWLIDFGFSEVAADDDILVADLAQLLAALSLAVGVERVIDATVDVFGAGRVGSSLRFLQPGALSGATRRAMRAQKGLLEELADAVERRCGIERPELVSLDRISKRTVVTLVMLAAVTYFLLPQLADVPGIVQQVSDADWAWLPLVLAASAVTYLGATLSILGASPRRVPVLAASAAQVGSSFTSKLAPAGLGGMALNTRFLQRSGLDGPVAVSSVGLNTAAGIATHVGLLVAFAFWAGRSAFGSIELPDPVVVLYGVGAVAALALAAVAVPAVRAQLGTRLVPVLRRSMSGVGAVLRRPSKLAMVLGGSAVVSVAYVTSLFFALQAFGGGLTFAQTGAIYLAASAVATAAPTPGGLGALEAAVIAGLVAAGLDNDVAVPAVFLYRLATFWIPILPGWLCFTWLQRREYV